MREKYFVGSDGDYPQKIYFSKKKAFASQNSYIDSFDKEGQHVEAYKLVSESRYVTEF